MARSKSRIDEFNSAHGYISKKEAIIELQDKVIENQTEIIKSLEKKVELLEEIVKKQDLLIEVLRKNNA